MSLANKLFSGFAFSLISIRAEARSPVAVVVSDELEAYSAPTEAFIAELGQQPRVYNIHGRSAEAEAVMAQLRADSPEVLFCVGAKAAYSCQNALPALPGVYMVYAAVLDPRRYGIVGDRVTGVTMEVDPVTYLSQFTGFFPGVQKIGFIRGPGITDGRMLEIAAAAVELKLDLVVRDAETPVEVRQALVALARSGVDALWVPPDRTALTTGVYRGITEEARRRHLPLLVETAPMVEAGGLFTMVPDPDVMGQQAAQMVNTVISGGVVPRPQDPERLLVVLNLRTLEAGELPMDRMMLDFVDRVIE